MNLRIGRLDNGWAYGIFARCQFPSPVWHAHISDTFYRAVPPAPGMSKRE